MNFFFCQDVVHEYFFFLEVTLNLKHIKSFSCSLNQGYNLNTGYLGTYAKVN